MQDLNDKITGGNLPAVQWNELPSEVQNVIEGLGQTLTSGDLNQLGKAIAGYVANGAFYTDSGAANAYVLTKIGIKQSLTAYTDGAFCEFIADNVNTGASTVNVATLGVKDIKLRGGADPAAGEIDGRVRIKFDLANDRFELVRTGVLITVVTATDAAWTPQPDTKSIEFTAIGPGGGGGGVDGQGAGTSAASTPGGGGGTSVILKSIIDASYNITIGAKGSGGAAGNNNGTAGGTTSVVSSNINISATGGGLGLGMLATAGNLNINGGAPGAGTGGDLNIDGGEGGKSIIDSGNPSGVGSSGASMLGGSLFTRTTAAGVNAVTFGAAGSGAGVVDAATNFAGGDGADGVVIVREYF